MKAAEYNEFVLDIYQSVSEPDLWPDILDRLAETVSARGCIIFEWRSGSEGRKLHAPLFTSNYDQRLLEGYLSKFSRSESRDQDMFERQSLGSDGIELVSEADLYSNAQDYLSQPHVKKLIEFGIRHRFGCLLDKDNTFRGRFAIQRGTDQGMFGAAETEILQVLLPHVAKALDLGGQVALDRFEKSALLSVVDRLSVGICVLDAEGRIVLRNALFDHHDEAFHLFRNDPRGRLSLCDPKQDRQFATLLQSALNHGRFGARPRKEAIVPDAPGGEGQLCIEVVPMEKAPEIGTRPLGGAMVITRDTMQPISIDVDLTRIAFGLTPAEAQVLEHVCQGLTNAQIAERRQRSVETINAQVKTILGKARAPNRTQLVRLLCSFASVRSGLTDA